MIAKWYVYEEGSTSEIAEGLQDQFPDMKLKEAEKHAKLLRKREFELEIDLKTGAVVSVDGAHVVDCTADDYNTGGMCVAHCKKCQCLCCESVPSSGSAFFRRRT